jgi:hypothetical protein
MNITHTEAPDTPATWAAIVAAIFTRQRELMEKYQQIEKLPSPPVSLHTAAGQRILKDFAWRSTEELTESFEALEASRYLPPRTSLQEHREMHRLHQVEEIADATHFLVELLIFAAITEAQVMEFVPTFPHPDMDGTHEEHQVAYWRATYKIGVAMNFLRNKPWKQSQVPTDEGRCRAALLSAWKAHVQLWSDLGHDRETMFNFYFRKSEVNKFRQRSNY